MKKENDGESEFKYLIKHLYEENSFKQEKHGYYSNDVGLGIYDKLPEEAPVEGWNNYRVIRSDSREFRDILVKDAGRLEVLIKKNEKGLKKSKEELSRVNDAWENKSTKYLIKNNNKTQTYLQVGSIGIYKKNVVTAIHDELPNYFSELDIEVINSDSEEFRSILSNSYNGLSIRVELERKYEDCRYSLIDDKKNFNIISKTLGSCTRKI